MLCFHHVAAAFLCCFSLVCQCVDVGYTVGGECSNQCEVLGGQRRCWGSAPNMCQTCQFSHTIIINICKKKLNQFITVCKDDVMISFL